MFMLGLFSWWYGPGWKGVLGATKRRIETLADMFSLSILMRTLFAPWKRIVSNPGAGIDARLRAFGDNLVSRCVGFTIRLCVLLAAAVSFILVVVAGFAELIIWPLLPVVGVALIVKGLL